MKFLVRGSGGHLGPGPNWSVAFILNRFLMSKKKSLQFQHDNSPDILMGIHIYIYMLVEKMKTFFLFAYHLF